MYNCELYSVNKNPTDVESFKESIDAIASMLYQNNIRVLYHTDIKSDPREIKKSLYKSSKTDDAPDYNIFVNALDTTDASSFKNLFYGFIKSVEEELKPDDNNQGNIAKIRITTIADLGNGYPGFCFRVAEKRFLVLPSATLAGKELPELIKNAVLRAETVFSKSSENPSGNLAYVEKKAKKEGFFRSFIPHKDDPSNTKLRKWIVIIALLVFLGAGGYLLNEYVIQPYLNSQITAEIHDIAYDNDNGNSDNDDKPDQNWDALKKINKEIVAWIKIKDTKVDYPVLEHKGDNAYSQYYLWRNYKKESNGHGSVFMDYRCTKSVKSKNVILHGHNMPDGSMFHALVNYGDLKGNLDYYKKHPVITFNTPEEDSQYKIISIFKTNINYEDGVFFNYMQGSFLSDAEFMNFVYNVRIRSLINCPVMVNEDDQILTLSTCSYEFNNWRTVVVARKLRENEKADVNIELATLNSKPVFPDVYYRRYGGTRPEELTFKKAYSKGLINWYDGKGDLEGSEVLTDTVKSNPTEPTDKEGNTIETEPLHTYQVKFVNWDGTEYYTVNVLQGDSVELPSGTPQLPSDDYYNYTFTGWQTDGFDLDNVQTSMTIYPDFKATLK